MCVYTFSSVWQLSTYSDATDGTPSSHAKWGRDNQVEPTTLFQANLSTIEMKRQSDLFGQWPNVTVEDRLPHLNLMNYQLRQLRSQLVLAAELGGAAAIVPEFMCGMGKDTYALDGRVAGSHTELPFRCPADMVLDFRTYVTPHFLVVWVTKWCSFAMGTH